MRHGVGRPRHLYDVTADAQDLFPATYDALAAGLLAAIGAVGGDELLERGLRGAAPPARRPGPRPARGTACRPDAPLAERVRELAELQAEQGYLAETVVGTDGTIRLREHNCAIYHVAKGTPAACQAELELFREVLGADVTRETHIVVGRPLLLVPGRGRRRRTSPD